MGFTVPNDAKTGDIFQVSYYEVISNTDTNEGRGSPIVIARCASFEVAKKMAKGKGVWSDAEVRHVTKTVVAYDGGVFEVGKKLVLNEDPTLEKALAKLAPEEIEVLKKAFSR